MRNQSYYNEQMIRKTIEVLKPNNELFEVRILGKGNGKKRTISGYFTDVDVLINAFDTIDPKGTNIYLTINKVNDSCYAREQRDCFRSTDVNTHDNEIDSYEWLFVDLDPIRVAEISSSNDELEQTKQLADKVANYMQSIGFHEPVRALSGNGSHLLYRIDLPNNDDNKKLIGRCLEVLATLFNTNTVKIDVVNHNQSRICKLYGTLAQKGSSTSNRPHRMSLITSIPDAIEINNIDILNKLSNELPSASPPKKITVSNQEFELEAWMHEHGLEPIRKDSGIGCDIYPLESCPFDRSHKNGDSKIFHYSDGAIAFKCHHNSCNGKKWQDVRELLEPGAYDNKIDELADKRIEEGWNKHKQYLTVVKTDNVEEIKKNLPKLSAISAFELQSKKFKEKYYAVEGMIPEGETIIAAPPKTGKSWLMLDMCLKIAKGEKFLNFETNQSDTLYLALEDGDNFEQERLNIVLDGMEAPKNFHFVFKDVMPMNEGFLLQLDELLKAYPGVKVVVIDTLQFIKYRQGKSESAYECDYRTGRELKQYAEEHDIAIVVVTHTTKMIHVEDDMANVSGTNGVTGAADSVIVLGKEKRTSVDAKMFITGRKVRQTMHNIRFDDNQCVWKYMGVADPDEKSNSMAAREAEYLESDIRQAVKVISYAITEPKKFRASQIVEMAVANGIGIRESNKDIGSFMGNMMGMFKAIDDIKIEIVNNGTGSRMYIIYPSFETIDDEEDIYI